MAKITRIKASDSPTKRDENEGEPSVTRKKVVVRDKKQEKTKRKAARQAAKAAKREQKSQKKTFVLFRPFVAFFRYLRDAWREIRQVRWPNRKTTWKMVLAVLVYTALFIVMISLLDLLFRWLSGLILG